VDDQRHADHHDRGPPDRIATALPTSCVSSSPTTSSYRVRGAVVSAR
jgi:hypothetical protein